MVRPFDLSGSDKPGTESAHIQRAWDRSIARQCEISISFKPAPTYPHPHSADWLSAPPIASVGLRFGCCKPVDARGLHGLACRRSGPKQQHHRNLNDIIWRAMKCAQIHAVKEPVGTRMANDRTAQLFCRGRPLAWDVTT